MAVEVGNGHIKATFWRPKEKDLEIDWVQVVKVKDFWVSSRNNWVDGLGMGHIEGGTVREISKTSVLNVLSLSMFMKHPSGDVEYVVGCPGLDSEERPGLEM